MAHTTKWERILLWVRPWNNWKGHLSSDHSDQCRFEFQLEQHPPAIWFLIWKGARQRSPAIIAFLRVRMNGHPRCTFWLDLLVFAFSWILCGWVETTRKELIEGYLLPQELGFSKWESRVGGPVILEKDRKAGRRVSASLWTLLG